MARFRNTAWNLPGHDTDKSVTNDIVIQALLMDIRDELRRLNDLLHCRNFTGIPLTLHAIKRNTTKKKRKVK